MRTHGGFIQHHFSCSVLGLTHNYHMKSNAGKLGLSNTAFSIKSNAGKLGLPSTTFGAKSGAGFTILEVIIVVGIVLIVIATVLPRFLDPSSVGGDRTADDAYDLAHLFSVAQSLAQSSSDNDHWGIHLIGGSTADCGSTTIVDCAVLYKGRSYTSRDTGYDQIFVLSGSNSFASVEDADFYFNKRNAFMQDLVSILPRPVARFAFAASSTVDITGNGHDGSFIDGGYYATTTGCSLDSSCFYFDAFCSTSGTRCSLTSAENADDCSPAGGICQGSYISVPDDMSLRASQFSVTAWVRPDHVSTEGGITGLAIIGKTDLGAGWLVYNDPATSKLCFYTTSQSYKICSDSILTVGQWYHVAATLSSTGMHYIYVNGVRYGPSTSLAFSAPTTALSIGATTDPGYYWHGLIDEAAYYDSTLTQQQVQLMAKYTHPTSTAGFEGVAWPIYITDGPHKATLRIFSDGAAVINENSL